MTALLINGATDQVDVPSDMPLLWVLRDVLGMTGTKFSCGMALCGACTIHIDGQAVRSWVTPVAAAAGKKITTIEAIGTTPASKKIQQAWAALDVLRMNESPAIEVHLVRSNEAPGGVGEPGCSCVMPALTNAVFAATGKRVRKLPVANHLMST